MKEIKKIEVIVSNQTTVWVAEDGTEFTGNNAERKCFQYELKNNRAYCYKEYQKLNPTLLDGHLIRYIGPDATIVIVNLKSSKDYDILKQYTLHEQNITDRSYDIDEPKRYPYNMVIIRYPDYVSEYDEDLNSLISEFGFLLEQCKKAKKTM
jgi:hypothetical protein